MNKTYNRTHIPQNESGSQKEGKQRRAYDGQGSAWYCKFADARILSLNG